jgi:UDP-N-acetylglucosamine/UDP-N-acetylgalactosamine diphosphorylase
VPHSEAPQSLLNDLREHGQEHVASWLAGLDVSRREALTAELSQTDFQRLDELCSLISAPPEPGRLDDLQPAPVIEFRERERELEEDARVRALGREALEAGRVCALTVAGGQGTRLRFDHPKGTYPISPVHGKSLFQLFAEQILAARRRYRCRLPWLVMTSTTNDAQTRAFFADRAFFDLGSDTVRFFPQGTNPILSAEGRLLRDEPASLLTGPDGHGGVFSALAKHGLLDWLDQQGVTAISYFQVDNPLVPVIDERFIGHHVGRRSEFSLKVIAKRSPTEGLGAAVLRDGRPRVIEYVDLPPDVASRQLPSGQLAFLYGSIAINVLSVAFAGRVAVRAQAMPWHIAKKQYTIVDDDGRRTLSPPEGCYKFERFVFDALELAQESLFVEVRRKDEFAPVKNADGEDSPATAREYLQRRWLSWLRQAGANVPPPGPLSEPFVEISPLYAADADELRGKLGPSADLAFPVVLDP